MTDDAFDQESMEAVRKSPLDASFICRVVVDRASQVGRSHSSQENEEEIKKIRFHSLRLPFSLFSGYFI